MSLSKVERIDRFGHCCYCADNLLTKRVVDGKVVDMFLPTYDDTMFLLNNGSQMQITICKKCKSSIDLTDSGVQKEIMDACMKGWELDTQIKVDNKEIDEEQRNRILDSHYKLEIDCHSSNLDKHVIQGRALELLNIKVEEIKEEVSIVSD